MSGFDREAVYGCRVVIFFSLSLPVLASFVVFLPTVTAIAHVPSAIIFRSTLVRVSFPIPTFMALSRFITAFATLSLSLPERPLTSAPELPIINAISPSPCPSYIDGSASSNWRMAKSGLKAVLTVHCSAVGWVMAYA